MEKAKHTAVVVRQTSEPYSGLATQNQTITRQLESVRTEPISEVFACFARAVLPFYRNAMSRYLSRLRKEGVFKAFEAVCDSAEPMLVIAISDGRRNLDGLSEGAKHASVLKHRVVVVVLADSGKVLAERLSDSEPTGTRTIVCSPGELWYAVNAEILETTRTRFRKPVV